MSRAIDENDDSDPTVVVTDRMVARNPHAFIFFIKRR